MIYFLTTQQNTRTINRFLGSWGFPESRIIEPLTYERFFIQRHFPPGVYIFTDIELLDEQQRLRITQIWEDLNTRGSDYRLLNHPVHSMRRVELLKTLYEMGSNTFEVCETTVLPKTFPVFVRNANDHNGSLSAKLANQEELDQEISRLQQSGENLGDLIVTGFCDTADEHGIYRKYSAFNVDGKIIPRHLLLSKTWMLKYSDITTSHTIKEENVFLHTNPHEQQLQAIFQRARIDFGRIDYSLLDGRIQVWEINTNPVILKSNMTRHEPRSHLHEYFYRNFSAALREINNTAPHYVQGLSLRFWRSVRQMGRYGLSYARWRFTT